MAVIFMVGGTTYEEARVVAELNAQVRTLQPGGGLMSCHPDQGWQCPVMPMLRMV